MGVSGTNFGKAAGDYGAFRAGFPESIFSRLAEVGIGTDPQVIVDLGTGTGSLARGFARRGCEVIGVDPDLRMIQVAIERDQASGVRTRYLQARAEATGLDAGVADAVTAGQCWHWFQEPEALAEVRRVLKPGGRIAIVSFDWLPLPDNVVEATEALITEHNPAWHLGGGDGTHREFLPGLERAGAREVQTFAYDVDTPYTPEAWRGRIRASAGVAALDPQAVQRFDDDLAELLSRRGHGSELAVPHRVFAITAAL